MCVLYLYEQSRSHRWGCVSGSHPHCRHPTQGWGVRKASIERGGTQLSCDCYSAPRRSLGSISPVCTSLATLREEGGARPCNSPEEARQGWRDLCLWASLWLPLPPSLPHLEAGVQGAELAWQPGGWLCEENNRDPWKGWLNITCVRHIWISGKQRRNEREKKAL